MDMDARDAAYRQEIHRLVRQQRVPAQKAEPKAFLAEFNHFDNLGFDVDIHNACQMVMRGIRGEPVM